MYVACFLKMLLANCIIKIAILPLFKSLFYTSIFLSFWLTYESWNTKNHFIYIIVSSICYTRASGQVVRALDCRAKHRWFEPNPRIIVGMLAHCSPSSKWIPGGNTGEVKGGEERNWPPYLTMPAAQDKYLSNGHSPTYGIVHGIHLYLYLYLLYIISLLPTMLI